MSLVDYITNSLPTEVFLPRDYFPEFDLSTVDADLFTMAFLLLKETREAPEDESPYNFELPSGLGDEHPHEHDLDHPDSPPMEEDTHPICAAVPALFYVAPAVAAPTTKPKRASNKGRNATKSGAKATAIKTREVTRSLAYALEERLQPDLAYQRFLSRDTANAHRPRCALRTLRYVVSERLHLVAPSVRDTESTERWVAELRDLCNCCGPALEQRGYRIRKHGQRYTANAVLKVLLEMQAAATL
eukprot:TRINITY_DN5030_c0_g1_i1.p1 TRINITY_DN5030_c0_g1~~TRINITY_DN5030_c0_g1_i1.p1  ORF type:complete len:245 (+),score=28.36 TRINITY_DN5030_c0_g1_i1:130-864(+)